MDFDKKKAEESQRQKVRWEKWQRDHKEAEQRAREFKAYWERRHQEDRNLWRDKDFANAVDKMSRAGYKGKFGNFEVPAETLLELDGLFMQVTVGDYGSLFRSKTQPDSDGNRVLKCRDNWKKHQGMGRVEAQREFIKLTNKTLTRYGWNPPEGWV